LRATKPNILNLWQIERSIIIFVAVLSLMTIANYPALSPGMFAIDVETGDYVDIGGDRVFSAASTIELPILLAFFEAVDAGQIDLTEILTVEREAIASGSGTLQYSPGKELTALQTATQTIVISDNTATNMIIDKLLPNGVELML
jgi:beta-lactamase class A